MTFSIDIHVHSRFSGDGTAEPEEYVERAIELGLDGIAFTEHYSYEASEYVILLQERYGNMISVLRGVELSAREGHCLVFGTDTDRLGLSNDTLETVTRSVNAAGGVVIPSHPFRRGHGMGDTVREVKGLCALEGYNGYNMPGYNKKAIETAAELGLPYTGGSDAHEPSEVGYCHTVFDDMVTAGNFVELLREGRYRGVDNRRVSSGHVL